MTEDPDAFDLPVIPLPVIAFTHARQARIERAGFWRKILVLVGRVPFVEDLVAAYFCVADPATPSRVRGVLLLALAWFAVPASIMPEFLVVFGLTDDAAVVALVASIVRKHIKEQHYERARAALGIGVPVQDFEIWS